jgi:mono/diheme cytochrome c family protein
MMQVFFRFLFPVLLISFQFAACSSEPAPVEGKSIYAKYCIECHGVDGKLQLNQASDLSKSALMKKDVSFIITNGRNTMQPFKKVLNEKQINLVVDYIMGFRGE